MIKRFEQRLRRLTEQNHTTALQKIMVGLERESLRVTSAGLVSRHTHPAALGSAHTNSLITTDYAESLLEFVTKPKPSPDEALAQLRDAMQYTACHIGDEYLWSASMPCDLDSEASIRIAEYGTSNSARQKHLYRVGLAYRYGKAMQMIAGIHYNFSFNDEVWPILRMIDESNESDHDFRSRRYLDLARNIQRTAYLVPYLFGASPALSRSFLIDKPDNLPVFDEHTRYYPDATSLRLSDLGYSNRKCPFSVSFNSLDEYCRNLYQATHTPCPNFTRIGLMKNGERIQLNTNILQIENEYYAPVRPKQPPRNESEVPSQALQRRGVGYVEMRLLDVSPFHPLGVDEETLYFLQAWMTACFLLDAPAFDDQERAALEHNLSNAAAYGRDAQTWIIHADGRRMPIRDALDAWFPCIGVICDILGAPYQKAFAHQQEKLLYPECTPSARVLQEMRDNHESFQAFAFRYAQQHTQWLRDQPLSLAREQFFADLAAISLQKQQQIEANDRLSFDDYLKSREVSASQYPLSE